MNFPTFYISYSCAEWHVLCEHTDRRAERRVLCEHTERCAEWPVPTSIHLSNEQDKDELWFGS